MTANDLKKLDEILGRAEKRYGSLNVAYRIFACIRTEIHAAITLLEKQAKEAEEAPESGQPHEDGGQNADLVEVVEDAPTL